MSSTESIIGLREQIKANATICFSSDVASHQHRRRAGNFYVPPGEAFEIIVGMHVRTDQYLARLLSRDGGALLMEGSLSRDVCQALHNLLDETAALLTSSA